MLVVKDSFVECHAAVLAHHYEYNIVDLRFPRQLVSLFWQQEVDEVLSLLTP